MQVTRVGDAIVAIVCDGVSSAASAADASSAATEAAGAVLVASLDDPDADGTVPMRTAMTAAQDAVLGVPWTRTRRRGAPACTFLGARWNGRDITVGAVGDCRAYWIDDGGVEQLTVDDSWVQEQVAIGQLSEAEMDRHPYAHAITRWLGEDAPGGAPRVTTFTPPAPGRLVLCSDGLWNYAPTNTAHERHRARPTHRKPHRSTSPVRSRRSRWRRAGATTSPWSSSTSFRRR